MNQLDSRLKIVDKTVSFISWRLNSRKEVRFRRRKIMEYLESDLQKALEEKGYDVKRVMEAGQNSWCKYYFLVSRK